MLWSTHLEAQKGFSTVIFNIEHTSHFFMISDGPTVPKVINCTLRCSPHLYRDTIDCGWTSKWENGRIFVAKKRKCAQVGMAQTKVARTIEVPRTIKFG
jgi:hypothetical protein